MYLQHGENLIVSTTNDRKIIRSSDRKKAIMPILPQMAKIKGTNLKFHCAKATHGEF